MLKSNWLTDSMALWFLCAFLFCCHFGWLGFFLVCFLFFFFLKIGRFWKKLRWRKNIIKIYEK